MKSPFHLAVKSFGRQLISRPIVNRSAVRLLDGVRILKQKLRSPHICLYYYAPAPFERKTHALADLLQRHGFVTHVFDGLSYRTRAILKSSHDLWIGFWNHVPLHLLPTNYIAINAEPIKIKSAELIDHEHLWAVMKGAREVWNYSHWHMEFAALLSVPVRVVPFGYAPYYEAIYAKHTLGKIAEQDIDVLFYGSMSSRRGRLIETLRQKGMNVVSLVPTSPLFGKDLDELLARSKIVLGIHFYDEPEGQIADFARLDHLLSNRVFVIHERPSDAARDPAFETHVTTCLYDELPERCAYYLTRPAERAAQSEVAYKWFKTTYPMEAFLPYDSIRALLLAR